MNRENYDCSPHHSSLSTTLRMFPVEVELRQWSKAHKSHVATVGTVAVTHEAGAFALASLKQSSQLSGYLEIKHDETG